ncbi:Asparagine-tRNA ligase, cytoplasmic [Purpureocillium lavendulum]|uniref:Asparagine-tRNA ligase, cytoplasmic n=1 Tax=Purpureocillium lavendulum TaxID=1247861 RepID=A0AB34G1G1_9HYPO|nr:Asparagine-tRNA ligase, cytoplasmic [Purpureocillium lavendulum]
MRFTSALCALAALGLSSLAAAAKRDQAKIIEAVHGKSTTCPTSEPECRTAAQAAPFIFKAFRTYKITCPSERAAVTAIADFESGGYRWKRNLNQTNSPGQGTSNMQGAYFNFLYARSVPELASKLPDWATKLPANITYGEYMGAKGAPGAANAEQRIALLDILVEDEYNFASPSWFMAEQCTKATRNLLRRDPDAGWAEYNKKCVGVDGTLPDRKAFWDRAKVAFGVKGASSSPNDV